MSISSLPLRRIERRALAAKHERIHAWQGSSRAKDAQSGNRLETGEKVPTFLGKST
jgi:hypothetical protein